MPNVRLGGGGVVSRADWLEEVAAAREKVGEHHARIRRVEDEIDNAEGRKADIRSQMDELESDIEQIRDEISDLESEGAEEEDALREAESALNELLDNEPEDEE